MNDVNLPAELTSFIGRGPELDQISQLVERSRLVTLTGAGGSGKTRLALALVADRLPAGTPVHWIELAPLRDAGLVVPAIAEAVGRREELGAGGLDALVRILRGHRGVLVLDNCEHLVETCAQVVDRLLRECPGVSVVATSREALGVPGERAWLVPPLALPAEEGDPRGAESVRLFLERARDVVPDFTVDDSTAVAVAEICRRLDGIPLAIELAAARVKMMQPKDLVARLDDVFRVLTTGQRTVVPRHRTLRATIEWSHDLLQEPARVLLRRIAVFRGGFGLGGAERVGSGDGIGEADVLDLVGRLVDRSMLGVREHHGFARYYLLEAVRQFATLKLQEAGEEEATRARQAGYVLELVAEAEPHLIRPERRVWVDRLEPEIDNIRSALAWTFEHDRGLHVRLVGKLWWFWFSTRHWDEAGRWTQGALTLPEAAEPGHDRAALLFAAGALYALQARASLARPLLEEAAALAAVAGDGRLEAYALNYLGMTYAGEGRSEAMELCGRAASWFEAHDDLYGLRLAALLRGSAAMGTGDMAEAERWNREGVRLARLFGAHRELAVSLQNLASVYLVRGKLDEAEALVREAMDASRRDPSNYFIATGLAYLGEIHGGRGRWRESARLLGAVESIRERIGAVPFPQDARRLEALVERLRRELGPAGFEEAWSEGRGLTVGSVLAEVAADRGPTAPAVVAGPGPVVTDGPALRVAALGPIVVEVEGERVEERFTYAKPRELLVYLLLHPGGGTRDEIGEALWPGAARARVKNSFHVTLHHLRKALGRAEWVVLAGERYRLAPEVGVAFDVDQLMAAARTAGNAADPDGLRQALALYRGELLEGDPAGRWIDPHRDRARRAQVELTLRLGELLEGTDMAAAARTYEALAAREALDEEVHRRLMAAWSRSGDRVRALRHYERLEALLRSELDAEPEPETVALRDEIRGGPAAADLFIVQ